MATIPSKNFHQRIVINPISISDFNVSFSQHDFFGLKNCILRVEKPRRVNFSKNRQILLKKAALLRVSDHYQMSQSSKSCLIEDGDFDHASSLFSNFWL